MNKETLLQKGADFIFSKKGRATLAFLTAFGAAGAVKPKEAEGISAPTYQTAHTILIDAVSQYSIDGARLQTDESYDWYKPVAEHLNQSDSLSSSQLSDEQAQGVLDALDGKADGMVTVGISKANGVNGVDTLDWALGRLEGLFNPENPLENGAKRWELTRAAIADQQKTPADYHWVNEGKITFKIGDHLISAFQEADLPVDQLQTISDATPADSLTSTQTDDEIRVDTALSSASTPEPESVKADIADKQTQTQNSQVTATPSPTPSPSQTPASSNQTAPKDSATPTPTVKPTETSTLVPATQTASPTTTKPAATETARPEDSAIVTATATSKASSSPTASSTPTPTASPTQTASPTPTATEASILPPGKPPVAEHFACGDYCPRPLEHYLVKVYQGVTDPTKCRQLGGYPYEYYGWVKTQVCITNLEDYLKIISPIPLPTNTATPIPTATPRPTGTATVVPTAIPTEIPVPTLTATPTATPTPESPSEQTGPIPLNDKNARYFIEKWPGERYVLNYAKNTDPEHPTVVYISKNISNLDQYLGKSIRVSGRWIEETQNIQCIKAPCPPLKTTVLFIENIRVIN